MFTVKQSFPEEKVIFASSSEKDAQNFFDLQVQHGKGWFELRKEGLEIPIQAGGEQFYSPYHPSKWDIMRTISSFKEYEKEQNQQPSPSNIKEKHNLMLTTRK